MQKYNRNTCVTMNAAPATTIVNRINATSNRIMMRAPSPASGTTLQRPESPEWMHRRPNPGTSILADVVLCARSRSL